MKVTPQAEKISNWLRFERCSPAWRHEIEAAIGVSLTPALIREGETTGLFRLTAQGFY